MVAITIVLALLVLLLFHMPSLDYDMSQVPQIFIIPRIYDVDGIPGLLNYDSRVLLVHSGTLDYTNGNLKAVFFKNGQPVSCVIDTMNGHDFISTSHFGFQWMSGAGCSGNL